MELDQRLNKVPEVTLTFWIIKVLGTTIGETAADFLSDTMHLGLGNTSLAMGALLLVALVVQFRAKRYVPAFYWTVVVLISVVGTLISDNLVDNMGVPLTTTTTIFSIALAAVFATWYLTERTLSVHTIYTRRRELFYWAAILLTFSLGTSAGDLASEGLGWGYLTGAFIFGGGIVGVSVGYFKLEFDRVLAFWTAYILTRPLGASLGDLLTQSPHAGGLGVSTGLTTSVSLGAIIGLVGYLTVKERVAQPFDEGTV